MIYETGLFDISYAAAGRRAFDAFGESTWSRGLVVVDIREGSAVGGSVLGVVEKSLHTPPAQKPRRINIEDVKPTDHA